MIRLYIETNFLVGFAINREAGLHELMKIAKESSLLEVFIPSICCMESLSVLAEERKRRNRFSNQLEKEIAQLRRSVDATTALSDPSEMRQSLQNALLLNSRLVNDLDNRLFEALEWVSNSVNLVELEPSVLQNSLQEQLIDDPTDNLILHCILEDTRQDFAQTNVFLSANARDFGSDEIRNLLTQAGISKYFTKAESFLGWFKSQPPTQK